MTPRKDGGKISRSDLPASRRPILLSRSDILLSRPVTQAGAATAAKDENGLWDIVEVKSSTSVKEVNLHDLALQRYVVEGSGVKIRKCVLMHINNEYVRRGEVQPEELFVQEDVTEQVEELLGSVEGNLKSMMSVIRSQRSVDADIGPHCGDPYNCPLIPVCWKHVPADSPLSLYRFSKAKAFDLINEGILKISSLPEGVRLNAKQAIQVAALKKKKAYIDPWAIEEFLETLEYPLFYLDFETFMTAVPMYDGVRPYQQVPFQFSLHIQRKPGGKVEHHSWLAPGDVDPRPELLSKLKELLEDSGSIVAYNAPFERTRLSESVEEFSKFSAWNRSIQKRFVDLLQPFRDFSYYHPSQHGSASIKAVLPALVGKSYEGLEIGEGGEASREYVRVTFGDVTASERKNVRAALEAYCEQDTMGMVEMVGALGKQVKSEK